MAVICECLSVITKFSTIEVKFVGGLARFLSSVPNQTYCTDGSLIRVGFMTPADVTVWVQSLEDQGLDFIREIDGEMCAIDIVVVDQVEGPTCNCEWIVSAVIEDIRWAWIAGDLPGELATPRNWRHENHDDLKKVLRADSEGLPIARSGTLDITIDPETAAPRYIGRPFAHQHDYDDLIRKAKIEVRLAHFEDAYALFLEAERIQPLFDLDCIEAALSSSGALLSSDSHEICSDAIRRWTEITEIGPGIGNANSWAERAAVEMFNGLIAEAVTSANRSIEIEATNWKAGEILKAIVMNSHP